MIVDKAQILSKIDSLTRFDLELGCGNEKKNVNSIGVDVIDFPCVDIVGDIYEVLSMIPNGSVDTVSSYHFIEHITDHKRLLAELARVTKPNAKIIFVAPHFSNPYFYSDPTHRCFFGLYTFCYLADGSIFTRKVPSYQYKSDFVIHSVDLVFKSSSAFPVRYSLKKIFGLVFNSSNFFKEFYEENLCYIFPCYEVCYVLTRS